MTRSSTSTLTSACGVAIAAPSCCGSVLSATSGTPSSRNVSPQRKTVRKRQHECASVLADELVTLLRVALTGGIATGKSFVLNHLASQGLPTIDADTIARDAVRPDQPASADIRQRFGDEVFRPDGEVDRPRLAARVFDNPEDRKALEAIVHPHVRAAIDLWFSNLDTEGRSPFAVADIPLLFETGRQGEFDHVVVTVCPPSLQLDRLMARDQISEAEARRRITAQLPTESKVAAADFVIHTEGSQADTRRQVDEVVEILRQRSPGSPSRARS